MNYIRPDRGSEPELLRNGSYEIRWVCDSGNSLHDVLVTYTGENPYGEYTYEPVICRYCNHPYYEGEMLPYPYED